MSRLTGTQKGGLALASVFVIGGLLMIVHPIDMVVLHPASPRYTDGVGMASQHVTKETSREIGSGAMLLGVAFASFVLCRSRE